MSHHFEYLESRRLMSVTAATLTADLQAGVSASDTVDSAGSALRSAVVADKAAIIADVKALETKTNRVAENKLIAALNSHDLVRHGQDTAALHALFAVTKALALQGDALAKALLAHPTNAALARAVAARATALNNVLTTRLNKVNTLLADSTFTTDLANITAANPSLVSTVQTDESALAPLKTAYVNALAGFQSATTTLVTDLTTLAQG